MASPAPVAVLREHQKPTTIREMVSRIQVEIRKGALSPDLARESLMTLTALAGNCADVYREAELAYTPVYLAALQGSGKANRAKIEAQCSPEYKALREAQDVKEAVKQMMITCRAYLRSLDSEMALSR